MRFPSLFVLFALPFALGACQFDFDSLDLSGHGQMELNLAQPVFFQNLEGEVLEAPVETTIATGTLMLDDRSVQLDDLLFEVELDCTHEPAIAEMVAVLDTGSELRLVFQQDDDVAGGLILETVADDDAFYGFSSGFLAMVVSEDCTTTSGVFSGELSDEVIEGSFVLNSPLLED